MTGWSSQYPDPDELRAIDPNASYYGYLPPPPPGYVAGGEPSTPPRAPRWSMWALIAGAVAAFAVVIAVLGMILTGGNSAENNSSPPVFPSGASSVPSGSLASPTQGGSGSQPGTGGAPSASGAPGAGGGTGTGGGPGASATPTTVTGLPSDLPLPSGGVASTPLTTQFGSSHVSTITYTGISQSEFDAYIAALHTAGWQDGIVSTVVRSFTNASGNESLLLTYLATNAGTLQISCSY